MMVQLLRVKMTNMQMAKANMGKSRKNLEPEGRIEPEYKAWLASLHASSSVFREQYNDMKAARFFFTESRHLMTSHRHSRQRSVHRRCERALAVGVRKPWPSTPASTELAHTDIECISPELHARTFGTFFLFYCYHAPNFSAPTFFPLLSLSGLQLEQETNFPTFLLDDFNAKHPLWNAAPSHTADTHFRNVLLEHHRQAMRRRKRRRLWPDLGPLLCDSWSLSSNPKLETDYSS